MTKLEIMNAYWIYLQEWQVYARTQRCRIRGKSIADQLLRMKFKPVKKFSYEDLNYNELQVYNHLVDSYERTKYVIT